ncbi:AMP-binding protein [Rhodococcus sp. ACS1]|uniref:AMP-binding protein n=1 Tax=Rhodococcus sp. ACS1 TaxID=2028570 RepID=UPI00117BC04D|nr:AMP-binding protein [Rhodococcus sp. ACS1]
MSSADLADRCSLAHLMQRHLRDRPDALAIREIDGEAELTWTDVHDLGLAWAGALAGAGVSAGDCVLAMLPNSAASFVTWLGSSYLGAVDVPVNDAYRGAWLDHVIAKSRASVAIVHADYLDQWQEVITRHSLSLVVVGGDARRDDTVSGTRIFAAELFLDAAEKIAEPVFGARGDIASVLWTSGTTGPSKGVMMPWGQWWNRVVDSNYLPDVSQWPDAVMYQPWPVFHVSGRESFYRILVNGGSLRLRRRFSTSEWLSDIRRENCDWTYLVGSTPRFLLDQPARADDQDNPLKLVLFGPAPREIEEFCTRFGVEHGVTSYGLTEVNNPLNSLDYRIDEQNYWSCGKLHPNRRIRLVDEAGRDVADGEPGELLVLDERAEHKIFSGYLHDPDATEAAFIDGWFHSGDLLRRDEGGHYAFVDRRKDAIRRRGENISSFEVEAAVNSHPDVVESAAFAVPSEIVEDEVMVVILRAAESTLSAAELRSYLEKIMPKFALPRYIEFADDLPKTPNQKVRKSVLRERGITDSTWDAVAGAEAAPQPTGA